jgi:hypothetical protein
MFCHFFNEKVHTSHNTNVGKTNPTTNKLRNIGVIQFSEIQYNINQYINKNSERLNEYILKDKQKEKEGERDSKSTNVHQNFKFFKEAMSCLLVMRGYINEELLHYCACSFVCAFISDSIDSIF